MSSYLNFYLKDKSGNFNPLDSFSRSNYIYQLGSDFAPYEAGAPLTSSICGTISQRLDEKLEYMNSQIARCVNSKTLVGNMINSVEEKLEAICALDKEIEEWREEVDEIVYAKGFFNTLNNILYNVGWMNGINSEDYIYFGIEWCPDYKEDENDN